MTVNCSWAHYGVVFGPNMFYWNCWHLTQDGSTMTAFFPTKLPNVSKPKICSHVGHRQVQHPDRLYLPCIPLLSWGLHKFQWQLFRYFHTPVPDQSPVLSALQLSKTIKKFILQSMCISNTHTHTHTHDTLTIKLTMQPSHLISWNWGEAKESRTILL